jgi:hypothetical protein
MPITCRAPRLLVALGGGLVCAFVFYRNARELGNFSGVVPGGSLSRGLLGVLYGNAHFDSVNLVA